MGDYEEVKALGYLREARAAMIAARDNAKRPSWELSIAITEAETAILWLQHDFHLKFPVENTANQG